MPYTKVERDQLVSDLKYRVVEVIFEARGTGELRKMTCTLMRSELPPEYQDKKKLDEHVQRQRDPNSDLVVVWDLKARGWRSFHLDSVVDVQEPMNY